MTPLDCASYLLMAAATRVSSRVVKGLCKGSQVEGGGGPSQGRDETDPCLLEVEV